jgi:hypothetical protein
MSSRKKTGEQLQRPTRASSPRKRIVSHKTLNPQQAPIYAYTFKDASRLSGIRLTTLRKWLVAGTITRAKDGAFNVTELWRLGTQENERRGGSFRSAEAERARNQYWAAKAEEKKMDVAVKRGELIDKERVTQALIERETVLKNRLLGLPGIFASRLVGCGPQEIKAICTEQIVTLLRDLAREGSEAYKKAHAG